MYEVFIEHDPFEYKKRVIELQKDHWHIQLLQYIVDRPANKPAWVITAYRDDGLPAKPTVQ
jgi:hypothetical protein